MLTLFLHNIFNNTKKIYINIIIFFDIVENIKLDSFILLFILYRKKKEKRNKIFKI